MLTPKQRSKLYTRISGASRQPFLSSQIAERCEQQATQRQLEFVAKLLEEDDAA